ncbi:cobaltochelatase subunit CobT [Woodsholea maritima]|uniref:cobaltochelatase subunit CobT n=1 Tax=Woodsholea maritima TaxID=240237 RepID=UPI000373C80D|nr:cobaltochelatase subunit CobT [Woodsholea maritima]
MADRTPSDTFKRALSATTRAIAQNAEVEIKFGGEYAGIVQGRVMLPNPPEDLDLARANILRGQADAQALRLALHDDGAHLRALPPGSQARQIFDAAEQARIEALGARAMKGMGDNLDAALINTCLKKGWNRVEDRQDAPMADALALMVRERISGRPVPAEAEGLMAIWRKNLETRAGAALDALVAEAHDQSHFAKALRQVLRDLDLTEELGEDPDEEPEESENDDEGVEHDPKEGDDEGEADPNADEDQTPEDAQGSAADSEDISYTEESQTKIDANDDPGESVKSARPNWVPPTGAEAAAYKVFTNSYDEIIQAEDLCDANELARLRANLDKHLQGLDSAVGRLANKLQRKLLAQQQRAWSFDLEEGILDPARLPRVVIDPLLPLSFKQEKQTDFRDTVVTLLLDNSGSMRGRPILVAAACADMLARTLERCGVKTEILGFTTRAWKGGRSKEDWVAAGKPHNPGRLNDLRHIIYKSADAPWRRARPNLGLMLRDGLLKENIDGEALQWAWQRLARRPEQRRILMVISDGAPVDDGTQSANSPAYLERHLRDVIAMIENRSEVELLAVGIGHDVTRYYRRAVTILDVEQLAGAMTEQLAALFDEEPRARRGSKVKQNPVETKHKGGAGLDALKRAVSAQVGRR